MTIDPAIFRALVEQGATPEMLLAVVEAAAQVDEARKERKRANNAERQARYRAKNNASNALPRVTERDSERPPNDIYSNPQNPCEADASQPPLAEKVVSAWNAGPGTKGARKATKLDASRKTLLKARLRDHSEAELFQAITNLAASRFHCGDNDRNWRADLGWFLKAQNFVKALEMEGSPTAANDTAAKPRASAETLSEWNELQRRKAAGEITSAEFFREQDRLRDAAEQRNGSTGPPRSVGTLVADIRQQAGVH